MPSTKIVRISDEAYERLRSWAIPLEDSIARVIERVLDVAEGKAVEIYSISHPRNRLLRSVKDTLADEGIEVPGLAERLAERIQRDTVHAAMSAHLMPHGPYLSLEEAAEEINLSASTLRQQVRAGRLQGNKIGRAWVTTREWQREYQKNIQRRRHEYWVLTVPGGEGP